MIQKTVLFFISLILFSCQERENQNLHTEKSEGNHWNLIRLKERSLEHLDSSKWDRELFRQDLKTYHKYTEVFQAYPLNKSPFPVAGYDYAVSSIPFTIAVDSSLFKGVRIGEYENPESENIIDKLTLLVLANDANAEETTLVDSRNYPYLTAQGIFKVLNHEFDWVFSASPDGFSTLLVNMKLFDLRFGETIVIYPQKDQSFLYEQINDSPNNYKIFEDFERSIKASMKFNNRLSQ